MNERIKELIEQSTSIVESPKNAYGWGSSYAEFDKEKFAELLIRECAGKVDFILREKSNGGGTMGDEIREHFGVKE